MYLAVHLCTLYDQLLAHTREDEAVLWLVMVRAGPSSQHCPALPSTSLLAGEIWWRPGTGQQSGHHWSGLDTGPSVCSYKPATALLRSRN